MSVLSSKVRHVLFCTSKVKHCNSVNMVLSQEMLKKGYGNALIYNGPMGGAVI